ncbi:MAG TPA: hypothetical protein PLU53_14115 [Bacteroidia bacterium]|nr:hypothetical protein [Bacteroidia bacterium]
MTNTYTVSPLKIQQWIADNFDAEKIQEELISLGCDSEVIEAHIKEFRKIKNAKRQSTGFTFLSTGALLGFISCVLSLVNPVPELYYWILYGFTSISVLCICIGLYYILE